MKVSVKRILCLLCVCLVFGSALLPSLVAPVGAVAGVDDAAMAVALWFGSAAGLTFGTAGDAFAAMQKFLSDQAETLSEVVSIVAEDVKDGVLSLRASKKAIYSSLITAIKSYFTLTADDTGALSGTISTGGIYSPVSASDWNNYTSYRFPVGQDFILKTGVHSYYWEYTNDQFFVDASGTYAADGYYFYKDGFSPNRYHDNTFGIFILGASERLSQFGISGNAFDFLSVGGYIGLKYYTVNNGALSYFTYLLSNRDGVFKNAPDLTIEFVGDNITYLQDAVVDGTSALDRFETLPQEDPDPDGGDDEGKKDIMVPIPLGPLSGTIENGQSTEADAEGNPLKEANPGLDPSQIIQQLTDAIANANPNPDPAPDPDPDPDTPSGEDDRTKRHDAQWRDLFPFCVPFDLIEFLGVLAADPVAPCFDWRFYVPNVVDYTIQIDLSSFDQVAKICRIMELLGFCVGLILLTRNIIRG